MSVVRITEALVHQVHGSRFSSFVSPSRGSQSMCAWRLDIPGGLRGVPHRPNREEVLLVLGGSMTVWLEGTRHELGAGDVVVVAADSELRIDAGLTGVSAWVTTTPGLQARLPDGTTFTPPWAQ